MTDVWSHPGSISSWAYNPYTAALSTTPHTVSQNHNPEPDMIQILVDLDTKENGNHYQRSKGSRNRGMRTSKCFGSCGRTLAGYEDFF